ncbi:MAG: hypothetical protein KAH38_03555, partial [Candidatus Hydrogenedentes bacterium]|nr:hypothetical protein [Candidatus Hydrogenedentota bacterium]
MNISTDKWDEPYVNITICGIGRVGLDALDRVAAMFNKGVQFVGIDSDKVSLVRSSATTQVCIGNAAKTDPIRAAAATFAQRNIIYETFNRADFVFILADLGSAVGCGSAPVMAEFARKRDIITMAFVVIPSAAEGYCGMEQHHMALDAIAGHADSYVVISEDQLQEYHRGISSHTKELYMTDSFMVHGVEVYLAALWRWQMINTTVSDISDAIRSGGRAHIGLGYANGEGAAREAAHQAVDCPLLGHEWLGQASRCISHICGGDDLKLCDVMAVLKVIQ